MKKIIFTILIITSVVSFSKPVWAEDETTPDVPSFTQKELQTLIAPIALYPDPLLAQILPAATYPLEIVEAARLIKTEKDQKKIEKQDWDPSVKAIAHYPHVLKMMNDDLGWTEKLGQAVLGQQEDVMQIIQDMRQEAQKMGNLKTTKEQIVTTNDTVVEIVPANPKIIYVPVYDPEIVYVVPYHHYHRPVITFGVFFPVGSWLNIGFYWPTRRIYHCDYHWWHGGWHDYYHRHHRHYQSTHVTNITNITNVNNYYGKKGSRSHLTSHWQHNNKHGTPYSGKRAYSQNTSHRQTTSAAKTNSTKTRTGIGANTKTHTNHNDTVTTSSQNKKHSVTNSRTSQKDNTKNFKQALNKTKKRDASGNHTALNNTNNKSRLQNSNQKISQPTTSAKNSNNTSHKTTTSSRNTLGANKKNYSTPPLTSDKSTRSKAGTSFQSKTNKSSSTTSSSTKSNRSSLGSHFASSSSSSSFQKKKIPTTSRSSSSKSHSSKSTGKRK